MAMKNILKRVACKLRNFFSEVFKRHTEDNAEQVVIVGAIGTIPDPDTLTSECPRPWLYTRVFMFFMLVTLLLFVANMLTNPGQFPNVFVIGSFAVPFTVLVLFFEFNVFKNISFYTVFKALFIGGALSLIVTAMLPSFWFQGITSVSDAFVAGIGEEIAKLLVVYWILKRNCAYPYVLNGLLVGAAVGAGFAIFETAGYCMAYLLGGDNSWLGKDSMFVLAFRSLLAPGGHVVWAAISGAGLLFAARREPLSAGMFRRKSFVAAFLVSVILHILWDIPFFESKCWTIGYMLILTFAAWCAVAWFIRRGLEEVDSRRAVVLYCQDSLGSPLDAGPWIRWSARMVDLMCIGLLMGCVVYKVGDYFGLGGLIDKANTKIYAVAVLPLLLIVEAVFYELFGTTFGKWLFALRVCDQDGRNATSKVYFSRLLRLWVSGLGFYVPLVSQIVSVMQYRRLVSRGCTTYDEALGLRVARERFHPLRLIAAIPVLLVVGFVAMAGTVEDNGEDAAEASKPVNANLEKLVSSAGLKCEWTETGVCIIKFGMPGASGRTQLCLVSPETVDSSSKERLFVCSMVAKCDAIARSVIDEMLAANAAMDARQWCKMGDNLALRVFLPMDVLPQKFRESVTQLAEDADGFEKRLAENDEF